MTFVSSLLDKLSANYCLDTGRYFATGMSNGGGFSGGVMACNATLSNRFAAFAPHSGALYTNTTEAACTGNVPYTVVTNNIVNPVCTPGRRDVPIIEFHGDSDGTIGYFGGGRRSYCLPALSHWTTDW